jgi:16S rRNA (guanine966-N2)-methyltransferase
MASGSRSVARVGAGTSAGRVIAGTARGVRLTGPGEGTRPLGDRMKQSLFAILEPGIRDRLFVDLYAGSGAAGIEALSRGASMAVFVERSSRAIQALRRNVEAAGFARRAIVVRAPVAGWLADARRHELADRSAAAVFIDPPYDAAGEVDSSLALIDAAGPDVILARDGVAVAKHFGKTELAPTRLLRSIRSERFGDTVLTFFRWAEEVAT